MTFVRSSSLCVIVLAIACRCVSASEPEVLSEKSIEFYDSAIQSDPQNSTLYSQRAAAYVEKKESNLALADFAKAIELDPTNPLPYRLRARYWSDQRETNNALQDLDNAIQLDPQHSATYAERGLNRALKLHWDEAFVDFDKALELEPHNADLYFNRAILFNARGDRQSAIEDLDTAIRLDPSHDMAYEFRGWQWLIAGRFSQSIEDFTEALRIDSHNDSAYMNRAIARMQQQEFQKALTDIMIADELDPRIFNQQDIAFVAQELLRGMNLKLTEHSPNSADAVRESAIFRDRGIAHRALEHWNEAMNDLNEAIYLDQSSSLALAVRGQLWLREQDWDRAIEDFDAALKLNPRDVSVWIDRGTAHFEKDEAAAACDDFTHAIEIDPRNQRALAKRGIALQAQEKLDLAIADYEQVMRGKPFFVHAPRSRWQDESPTATPAETDDASSSKIDSPISDDQPILESRVGLQLNETGDGAFIRNNPGFDDASKVQSPDSKNSQFGSSRPAKGMLTAFCLDPIYLMVFVNRAKCMEKIAQWEQALKDYEELTRLAPADPLAYRHIAWLAATCPDSRVRNPEKAVRFGLEAVERGHTIEDYLALSAAYADNGDFATAKWSLSRAREIAAEHAEKELQACRQRFKAAEFEQIVEDQDENSSRDKTINLEAAVNACEQSQWKDARAIEILADTYAAAGQFDDAIACCEKRHELIVEERDKPLRDLLELYNAGQPCRADLDQLVASSVDASITPIRQLVSNTVFDRTGVILPADRFTVVQLRLLSFNPKQNRPAESTRRSGAELEVESVESTDQSEDSGQAFKANQAHQLVIRGLNRQRQGEFEQAIKDFQEAIQVDSQNTDAFNAIARLLATCSNEQIRNGKQALKYALIACELSDWKAWNILDTLAAAYAETGDFTSAIQWTETSIELIPFDEPESETERLQKNLELYRQNKPIRK